MVGATDLSPKPGQKQRVQFASKIKRKPIGSALLNPVHDHPDALARVDRVTASTGDRQQAVVWFNAEKIPALGDKTPAEMVGDGRASAVKLYLDYMDDGNFA